MPTDYDTADLSQYALGNCDIMAIALNRLTGLPFGLLGAEFPDDQGGEGDMTREYAHAVVIVDLERQIIMDAWGVSEGMPDNLYFSVANPQDATIFPVGEEDVRNAFTCIDIEEASIQAAMDLVSQAPWIEPFLQGGKRHQQVERPRP